MGAVPAWFVCFSVHQLLRVANHLSTRGIARQGGMTIYRRQGIRKKSPNENFDTTLSRRPVRKDWTGRALAAAAQKTGPPPGIDSNWQLSNLGGYAQPVPDCLLPTAYCREYDSSRQNRHRSVPRERPPGVP